MTFIPKQSSIPGYPCGAYCYVCTCEARNRIVDFEKDFAASQVSLGPEISNMVDENFWDLVGDKTEPKK